MDFCNKEKPEKCKKKVFSLTLLSEVVNFTQ